MYTVKELSELLRITKRQVRFYEEKGLIIPMDGALEVRQYSEEMKIQLELILLLKQAEFTLQEIADIIASDTLVISLVKRRELLIEKSMQIQSMLALIDEVEGLEAPPELLELYPRYVQNHRNRLWEKQFSDPSNLQDRIDIHAKFSANTQGWFPWVYEQIAIAPHDEVLEIGCGTGGLWEYALPLLPDGVEITLTDKSEEMVQICRGKFFAKKPIVDVFPLDVQEIGTVVKKYDKIIMNHVIYILANPSEVLAMLAAKLKPGGKLFVATLGENHMLELRNLLQKVNKHINLQTQNAPLTFHIEQAHALIPKGLEIVAEKPYLDSLIFTDVTGIEEYIYSVKYISNLHQFEMHALKHTMRTFLYEQMQLVDNKFAVQKATTLFTIGVHDEG